MVLITLAASTAVGIAPSEPVFAVVAPPTAAAAEKPVPFYVVKESVDGQPEFLFEIAERFLGKGDRYPEIFTLNKGRKQADGEALTDPAVLNAGWALQLPADARGAGLQNGPLPGSNDVPPTSSAQPAPATASPDAPAPPIALWIVVAILIAAAVASAALFVVRRRRAAPPKSRERDFAVTDRSASWTIDSALKILTSAGDSEQIDIPGIYLVTMDGSAIHLLLSSPSVKAPSGWTASPDGRTWTATLAQLQGQRVPDTSNEPFAGLATLGTAQTGRTLVDFSQARGLISVEGPPSLVADVVDGWVTELTSNPWSGSPKVIRFGNPDASQRESFDRFLARLAEPTRGIAVLDGALSRSQAESIRTLFSAPSFGWIVIVTGAEASASWRFTVHDGLLTSGFLPDVRISAPTSTPSVPSPAN
jgi:hypothetical protein